MKKTELKNCPEWLMLADTKNEDVEYSSWGSVVWNGGEFRGGEFLGGEFRGGYFRGGEFLGGEFRGGEFLGGYFRGGEFLGGEFLGGVMMPMCKWVYGVNAQGLVKIGCKEKTVDEWDAWFAGTEEFSTERGTIEFKKIQASFESTKAYLKICNPYDK